MRGDLSQLVFLIWYSIIGASDFWGLGFLFPMPGFKVLQEERSIGAAKRTIRMMTAFFMVGASFGGLDKCTRLRGVVSSGVSF